MMFIRSILIVLLTALLFNCSEYPEDTEVLRLNDNVSRSQGLGDDVSVSINPVNATVNSIITLRADNLLLANGKIKWYINGKIDKNFRGPRFVSSRLKKEDVVQAAVVSRNGNFFSNKVTIKNSPPTISKAMLSPPIPGVSSVLKVEVSADDNDGDIVAFRYVWHVNEKAVGEHPFLEYDFKREDNVSVKVIPYDKEDEGRSITLKSRIFNSLPVISESSPLIDEKTYKYQIMAKDPDGDTFTFRIEQGPDSMTIDPSTGVITWTIPSELKEEYDIRVSVSDDQGGKIIVPFTTRIFFTEKQ